jgi:hypothetical protein
VSWSGSGNGTLNANCVSTYKDLSVNRFRQAIFLQKYHSIASRGFGCRIHCGVEVTELSTNKQNTLSPFKAYNGGSM